MTDAELNAATVKALYHRHAFAPRRLSEGLPEDEFAGPFRYCPTCGCVPTQFIGRSPTPLERVAQAIAADLAKPNPIFDDMVRGYRLPWHRRLWRWLTGR